MKWSTIVKGEIILFTFTMLLGAFISSGALIGISIIMLFILTIFACIVGEK